MLKLLEPFMEDQTDDDAVPVQKNSPARMGRRRKTFLQKKNLPRLKQVRKEGRQFQTQGRSQLFRVPKYPDCDERWMTKATRARRRNIHLNWVGGISLVTSLGDHIKADLKVASQE